MNQHFAKNLLSETATADWLAKASQLMESGQFKQALAILLPHVQQGPLELRLLDRTAMCYFELGDTKSALSLMAVLTQIWPDVGAGWAKLASMRQSTGDLEGAVEAYQTALKKDPDNVPAMEALNCLEPFAPGSSKVARLRKLAKSKKLPGHTRAIALNTLGTIERKAGNTAAAFRYFAKSNEAAGGKFKPEAIDALVDSQEAVFEACTAPGSQQDGPRVIFICGMPRSGTTLTESILMRHSQTGSVGESKALSDVMNAVREHVAVTGRGAAPWDWFGKLTGEEIAIFRKYYYERALMGGQDTPVIIDKMPANCLDLGLAHVLMPDAKFVFMSRHPLDVGLSNFSTCFNEIVSYSCRLDWLAAMTQSCYRSAADYQSKLGGQLRVQSFEALVTDSAAQIAALLEHTGLGWEEACLSPEESAGTVRTASVLQVREKINTKGLGKWQAFEEELQPLTEALDGGAWIQRWQHWDQNAAHTGRLH